MFSVITTYTGGAADKIRSMLEETSMKDLEESYRKYYSSDFEGIRQAAPITWIDDSLKNELTVNEHYAIPSLWTTDKQGKKSFSFGVKIISEFLSDPSNAPAGIPLGIAYPPPILFAAPHCLTRYPKIPSVCLTGPAVKNNQLWLIVVAVTGANPKAQSPLITIGW